MNETTTNSTPGDGKVSKGSLLDYFKDATPRTPTSTQSTPIRQSQLMVAYKKPKLSQYVGHNNKCSFMVKFEGKMHPCGAKTYFRRTNTTWEGISETNTPTTKESQYANLSLIAHFIFKGVLQVAALDVIVLDGSHTGEYVSKVGHLINSPRLFVQAQVGVHNCCAARPRTTRHMPESKLEGIDERIVRLYVLTHGREEETSLDDSEKHIVF